MKQKNRKVKNKIKTQLQAKNFLVVCVGKPRQHSGKETKPVFGTSHDIPGNNVTTLGKPPKRLNIKPKK